MIDLLFLASEVTKVPASHRRQVFLLFLTFLTDAESIFEKAGPMQPMWAAFVLKILLGTGNSANFVAEDNAMAQALEENWKIITRWVRLFCDKFKSTSEPFPKAKIPYHGKQQ